MLVSVAEKLAWGIPVLVLFLQQRLKASALVFGCIDLVLGAFFVLPYFLTSREARTA